MDHDIGQINYDLNRIDGMTTSVAGTVNHLAERIARLERDRTLLLRYFRALVAVDRELDSDESIAEAQFAAQIEELRAARQAVDDAGLLEDDDA